jgi:ribonuclease HI
MDGSGSMGAVLRHHKGEAIAGIACTLQNVLSAATAEALALLRGLEFLEELGCFSVIIESDSLDLIQACNGVVEVWSPYSAIMVKCFLKASSMKEVLFQHCNRDANQVAHSLARHVYESKENLVWNGDPPKFILPFVILDVTILSNK